MAISGSCLCGAVKYEVAGDPMMSAYCHCSRCRRFTGAAAEPALLVATEQVNVTAGRDNIEVFRPEGKATRGFCKTCGSSLFSYQWPDGPMTVVTMGTLDGDPGLKPQMHIQVAHKAAWDEITDDLPQHAEMPG